MGVKVNVIFISGFLLACSKDFLRLFDVFNIWDPKESLSKACGGDVVFMFPGDTHGSSED